MFSERHMSAIFSSLSEQIMLVLFSTSDPMICVYPSGKPKGDDGLDPFSSKIWSLRFVPKCYKFLQDRHFPAFARV